MSVVHEYYVPNLSLSDGILSWYFFVNLPKNLINYWYINVRRTSNRIRVRPMNQNSQVEHFTTLQDFSAHLWIYSCTICRKVWNMFGFGSTESARLCVWLCAQCCTAPFTALRCVCTLANFIFRNFSNRFVRFSCFKKIDGENRVIKATLGFTMTISYQFSC